MFVLYNCVNLIAIDLSHWNLASTIVELLFFIHSITSLLWSENTIICVTANTKFSLISWIVMPERKTTRMFGKGKMLQVAAAER